MRTKKYSFDKKAAEATLQNVFAACDTKPNETSFDTIFTRNLVGATVVRVGIYVSIALLIFLILSPMAFINDSFKVSGAVVMSDITVAEHHLYEDRFEMILNGNGVEYGGIYCKKADGSVVIPLRSDPLTCTVEIPFDGDPLNIYIPCSDGKVVQAILSK